jgi:uncharacterized protein (DUF697 family)/predicted GTPase
VDLFSWLPPYLFSGERARGRLDELICKTPAPTFWLFGRAQSGKSSVVKYLTGASDVQIGEGYRPCTRHSRQYAFPSAECPVLRFLDTPGLGEADYDPAEDIQAFEKQAHAMIVTVPLTDFAQQAVVEPLRRIRSSCPDRPVLLALTCLHRALPDRRHPPYPFDETLNPPGLPEALQRPLAEQRKQFAGLADAVVPVDLTHPDDGFECPDYGGPRLRQALAELLPDAQRQAFLQLKEVMAELADMHLQQAAPYIAAAVVLAGGLAALPVPYVDIPAVMAVQAAMVRQVGVVYNQTLTREQVQELVSAVGGGILLHMGVRGLLKLIPYVGAVASVAAASSTTLALGRASCWYYAEMRAGHVPRSREFARVFHRELRLHPPSSGGPHAEKEGSA